VPSEIALGLEEKQQDNSLLSRLSPPLELASMQKKTKDTSQTKAPFPEDSAQSQCELTGHFPNKAFSKKVLLRLRNYP
jgi:hypothetical protein